MKQWVDGVSAAAVDENAGWAEQAAEQRGIAHGNNLTDDEPVAPGLERRGVELLFSGDGRGCSGGGRDNGAKSAVPGNAAKPAADRRSISLRVSLSAVDLHVLQFPCRVSEFQLRLTRLFA